MSTVAVVDWRFIYNIFISSRYEMFHLEVNGLYWRLMKETKVQSSSKGHTLCRRAPCGVIMTVTQVYRSVRLHFWSWSFTYITWWDWSQTCECLFCQSHEFLLDHLLHFWLKQRTISNLLYYLILYYHTLTLPVWRHMLGRTIITKKRKV